MYAVTTYGGEWLINNGSLLATVPEAEVCAQGASRVGSWPGPSSGLQTADLLHLHVVEKERPALQPVLIKTLLLLIKAPADLITSQRPHLPSHHSGH